MLAPKFVNSSGHDQISSSKMLFFLKTLNSFVCMGKTSLLLSASWILPVSGNVASPATPEADVVAYSVGSYNIFCGVKNIECAL